MWRIVENVIVPDDYPFRSPRKLVNAPKYCLTRWFIVGGANNNYGRVVAMIEAEHELQAMHGLTEAGATPLTVEAVRTVPEPGAALPPAPAVANAAGLVRQRLPRLIRMMGRR